MRGLLLPALLLIFSLSQAQTTRLHGKVTSAAAPTGMPGVTVVVQGTTSGTITDVNGEFTIEVANGAIVQFTFVGHKSQQLVYTGQAEVSIVMEEEAAQIDEVVVVGYSSIARKDITGAVSTVQFDKLKEISLNGMDQALQGQAPGVQVTQSSGTPGGGVVVHIRGVTSLSAVTRPLYIVDGIPISVGAVSSRDFGGQDDNALALINPNDIESSTVLSDAAAKALYGARASNGVIVITTKRGKSGATKISFDVQRGIIDPVRKLKMMNATQLLTLQREAVTNAGQNPDALGLIPGVTDAVNTDWQDAVLRRAIMQQYQLSARGGNDNTKFYFSGGYREEQGIQLNNSFQRLNFTSNIDQKLTERLTMSINLTLSRTLNKRVKGDNFLDGVYSGAIKSLPFNTPYDENGVLVGPASPLYAGFPNFNPVAQALLPRFNTITVKGLGNINLKYKIQPDLELKVQGSLDYTDITEDQYESSQTAIGGYLPSVGGQGYGIFTANTIGTVNGFATLTYNKDIAEKHKLSGVVGTELYRTSQINGSLQGRLFPSDDFTYITSAGIVDAGSSFKSAAHSILSFFGEARYDYAGRVLVTGSLRADGSSNFGQNHRFGYFPALSAAWRISEEKFFHSNSVSSLKLRGSIGLTGNERIPQFSYLATWNSAPYSGSNGVSPNSTDNPNVRWETTREINFGVDAGFLNDRFQATINVYKNHTYNLLLFRPYPYTTGFAGVQDNIGTLENKGIEFSAQTVNLEGPIRWTTTFNISKNLNKVLSLSDTTPVYRGYTANGVDGTNIVKVGQPIGSFWGLNYLGVDPATGRAMYQDRNHDQVINNSDAMIIGNSQPKFYGGITNRLQYKGFDMSIFFSFSVGNKVLNFTKASTVNMGGDIQTNQSVDALRRWEKPGDVTDIPKYALNDPDQNNLHTNRLLEDASVLRLKNLNIGYNLPPKILQRLMLEQLRVYVSATNLWTLTKYSGSDPEVSTLDGSDSAAGIDFFTLPQVRTISVGFTAVFK